MVEQPAPNIVPVLTGSDEDVSNCAKRRRGEVRQIRTGIGMIITLIVLGGCSRSPTGPGGGGWTFEPVANGDQVGLHSSLTTTSDGSVHILYHDAKDLTLHHARRVAPGKWERVQVDTIGWKGEDVVISRGAGDTLHVAYQDMFVDNLRYASFDGTSWAYERIDPFRSAGEEPIIDPRGDGIHLLELKSDRNNINYWHGGLGNWTLLSDIHVNSPRSSLALAHGPTGHAVAVFATQTTYYGRSIHKYDLLLFTAADPAGQWTKTVLVTDLLRSDYSFQSLAMDYDQAGQRHILYRLGNGDLIDLAGGRIARGVVAGRIRIKRGPGGELWVLYPFKEGLGISRLYTDGWRRETSISDLNSFGKWSMHIDENGTIHVSIYSHAERRLWYGRWEPGA